MRGALKGVEKRILFIEGKRFVCGGQEEEG